MRILVVDDEPLVRRGIISMLEKDIEDVVIVGEAGTGSAAIKIIEKENPDVVLTDIIMPSMNGIELLKWIMLNRPEIKSVVLSCHQEFQYVKDAFLFGAIDYVLKYGIDTDVLVKMIDLLKNALSRDKKIAGTAPAEFFENDLDMIKSGFIRNIINGRIADEAEIFSKAKKYKLSVSLIEPSFVINIAVDNKHVIPEEKKEEYVREFIGLASEAFSEEHNFELVYEGQYSFILIVQPKSKNILIDTACRLLQRRIKETLGISVSAGISKQGNNFKHFAEMLTGAKKALEQKFFFGESSITFFDEAREQTGDNFAKSLKKDIIESITELSLSDAIMKLEKLNSILMPGDCCNVLQSKLIYISIEEALINVIKDQMKDIKSSNREILESEFLCDINLLLKEKLIEAANRVINILDTRDYSKAVYKVIVFINSHYSDSGISLEMIAGEFGYTPSYLSRLFKQETRKNIVDYVNEVRIFTAKKMLRQSGKKVYEIAESVGYSNYNYFSKVFKQYEGVSPSEFS